MHTHHHHFLHFLKNRELDELYASIALRSFALSMIGIFIPIYLLKLGFQLSTVFSFYLILTVTHVISVFPAAKISAKLGFKHSIFLSMPLLIISYILLYAIKSYNLFLYIPAIILGLHMALFWTSYHMDFSKFSGKRERGKEVGLVSSLMFTFNVLGPLFGGFIISAVGFGLLFIFVSALLLFSALPLLLSKDFHEPFSFSLRQLFFLRGTTTAQKMRDGLSFFGWGMENVTLGVIWPVFIFFYILNSYTSLGFVTSLSLFFSMIFSFVVGFFSDIRKRLVLKLGVLMNIVVWIIRTLVKTSFHVFAVDSLYGISRTTMGVPFDTITYDKANKTDVLKYIALREIMVNAGRSLVLIFMILFSDFITSFFLAGFGSILLMLF